MKIAGLFFFFRGAAGGADAGNLGRAGIIPQKISGLHARVVDAAELAKREDARGLTLLGERAARETTGMLVKEKKRARSVARLDGHVRILKECDLVGERGARGRRNRDLVCAGGIDRPGDICRSARSVG